MATIRRQTLWLVLALVASAALAAGLRRLSQRDAGRVLTGDSDAQAMKVWAEPAAAQPDSAALSGDGRREGSLPYGYRAPQNTPAELHLRPAAPERYSAVVVSWMRDAAPPSAAARLSIDAQVSAIPAADADAESVVWLDAPRQVHELSLLLPAHAPSYGVAELAPLPSEAPIWLLSPRARADSDLELLAVYGAPGAARLPRLPIGPQLGRVWGAARVIVASNAPLPAGAAQPLREYVAHGGTLIELGPRPAVCGPPALPTGSDDQGALHVVTAGAAPGGARWPVPVARSEPCDAAHACDVELRVQSASGELRPLVVTRRLGSGRCTRWLGDLSAAVRRLRQGDPALSRPAPGAFPIKPADLFVGQLSDADLAVPSADRLGYALAAQLTAPDGLDVLVAPLPDAKPALVVFTADQDFVPAQAQLAQSAAMRGAGFTALLTAADIGGQPDIVYPEARGPMLELDDVQTLGARGHGVGIHPNLVGLSPAAYGSTLAAHAARFRERYAANARVVRNHHLIWLGYVRMAELLAGAGLLLDLDYVSTHRSGRLRPGFMTGSGLPMRFMDDRGRVLPIFQQATQLDDSALIMPEAEASAMREAAARLGQRMQELLRIAEREHVALTLLHHAHWWFQSHGALQNELLSVARARALPVWGAERWLRFNQARRATRVRRAGAQYKVSVPSDGITLLVEGARALRVNGRLTTLPQERWLGQRFAALALPRGDFTLAAAP